MIGHLDPRERRCRPSERTTARRSTGDVSFLITRKELAHDTSLLAVEGDLDLASAPSLKWALADVQSADSRHVVVDLSKVGFIDSTALGVLVGAQRALDPGVRLAIACAEENVLRIFELTGLDGMFEIVPTLAGRARLRPGEHDGGRLMARRLTSPLRVRAAHRPGAGALDPDRPSRC